MNILHTLCLASLALLVGCAAPPPKPAMTEHDYTRFATELVTLYHCSYHGHMAPEVTANGKRYLMNKMAVYSYDRPTMEREADRIHVQAQVTVGDCNVIAAKLVGIRQGEIQQNNQAQSGQKAWNDLATNRPKQTICNKVGTQTLCSTF